MPVINLPTAAAETCEALSQCDVCIIGSGPAGSTIARELSGTRLRVTILESGGVERTEFADSLNQVVNVGRPRVEDQWAVRNRILGGSSYTWGGRCGQFDEIDYEARPWVPYSGWPLEAADFDAFLESTAAYLGLAIAPNLQEEGFWRFANIKPKGAPNADRLMPFFWQFSRHGDDSYRYEYMRFGRQLLKEMPANVTLVTQATVLRVVPVASGRRVQSVLYAASEGQARELRCEAVVLCGGGIENARLLLMSDDVTPRGLGNDRDLVGRFLMDHPRGPVGTFDLQGSRELQRRLGRYNVRGHLFRAGVRLSPTVQRDEGLLNCAAWLGEVPSSSDPLEAVKRMARGKPALPSDLITLASNAAFLARGCYDYFVRHNGLPRKLTALTLDAMCEQRPDPESRVTLSDRRDRLGLRRSQIDWRVHADEARSMRRIAELVAEEFPRLGLPAPQLADWVRQGASFPADIMDVGHPTGTTRMAESPSRGVVDRDCMVFGVDGLYVSGSSVFPTAGHCNPTHMIVAMALRLAAHLKTAATIATPIGDDARRALATLKPKVLLTGATGRIGRVVLADLLERGYHVRATTSKMPLPVNADHDGRCEWHHVDFLQSGGYDDLLEGCSAVIHLAAELGAKERMVGINTEATRRLAEGAERLNVASFCYVSSVSVYGSGRGRIISEEASVLTDDHDVRSEYWALAYVRAYGRTKLAGEHAIRAAACKTRYTIFRPTVVVDVPDIIGIRDWSLVKRVLAAHRHSHHVYVWDVSDALIWSLEKEMRQPSTPGSVEVFNLSEDDYREPTHAAFLAKAWAVSGDRRFRVVRVPGAVDWLHDFIRFHSLPLRNPLWRMRFPNNRLRAAGYSPRYGMAHAYALALGALRAEARGEPRQHDARASLASGALLGGRDRTAGRRYPDDAGATT